MARDLLLTHRNQGSGSLVMQEDQPFLRSINVVFDAEVPERVLHYEPTSKAIAFLRGVSGQTDERTFFVIAPYGSGKSVSATYLLQLLENRTEAVPVLTAVGQRLLRVAPELGSFAEQRMAQRDIHGVVLALDGAVHDIGIALRESARAALQRLGLRERLRALERIDGVGIVGAIAVLDLLKDKSKASATESQEVDRVVVMWDEFGRHVEQLVRSGNPQRLAEIQTLAEYASRSQRLPITMALLMHQGLLQYAKGLSQSMLAEWRKVEGRFAPIQYVDDSRELYRLISQLVSARKPTTDLPLSMSSLAEDTRRVGLLTDLEGELEQLLERSHPLEPAALHILPRLAARAAQHERTLFGFVLSADLTNPVRPDQLYDYFAPAMQNDTGVGGTYRKWLETESALSKVDDEFEIRALKTASILELGLSGERSRVSRALLEFALGGSAETTSTVDRLLDRKLLLHRKRTDQISLWHGTDVDLRRRLEEELARLEGDFDVLALLNKEFRPTAWRPIRYNDTFRIRRYFECEFISADALQGTLGLRRDAATDGPDGRVLYVVPLQNGDCEDARESVAALEDPMTVVAVPREMIEIRAAAAELIALSRMQRDEALLAEDPLVRAELQQMLDETQIHLHRQLSRLTEPSESTTWFSAGQLMRVRDRASLLDALSTICKDVYGKTPVINNEMINRHRPSPQLVNARRKVIMGILERHGQERLGISGEFADASVFRTVLANTGLYVPLDGEDSYGYMQPEALRDRGLREVWQQFKELLTDPRERPKDLEQFFADLSAPPYGIRAGVVPILFAAAMKAFPSALTISDENGRYLEDLLPSDIEDICRAPHGYSLTVLKLEPKARKYLLALGELFDVDVSVGGDLVRAVFDGFEAWRRELPPGALETREVSAAARGLQQALSETTTPVHLFFQLFPRLAGANGHDYNHVLGWLSTAKDALSGVVDLYRDKSLAVVNENLRLISGSHASSTVRERFERWRETLPVDVSQHSSGLARALLRMPLHRYADDYAFADALGAVVAEKKPQRWNDSDVVRFRNSFASLISQIESRALSVDPGRVSTEKGRAAVTQLYTHRIQTLVGNLTQAIGCAGARAKLREILNQLEEAEHGDSR